MRSVADASCYHLEQPRNVGPAARNPPGTVRPISPWYIWRRFVPPGRNPPTKDPDDYSPQKSTMEASGTFPSLTGQRVARGWRRFTYLAPARRASASSSRASKVSSTSRAGLPPPLAHPVSSISASASVLPPSTRQRMSAGPV